MIIIRNNDPKNPLIAKSSLSPKALGMLALILICPTPGLLTFDELVDTESGDEESVLEGLAELYESGYLLFFRWQTPGGNWVEEYLIFESPELRNKYLKTLPDDRKQYITSPMPKKYIPMNQGGMK